MAFYPVNTSMISDYTPIEDCDVGFVVPDEFSGVQYFDNSDGGVGKSFSVMRYLSQRFSVLAR